MLLGRKLLPTLGLLLSPRCVVGPCEEEKRRWAEERLAYYEREGLVLETEKMRQLIRACDLELREMEQIVAYRKDETRVIQIQPRSKRPS